MNFISKFFGKNGEGKQSDLILFFVVFGLLLLGLMMVTSVGVPKSIDLSMKIADVDIPYPDCSVEGIDCYLILKQHFVRMVLGLLLMFAAWKTPLTLIRKVAPLIYFTAVSLLVYVLFLGAKNGTFASSWVVVDLPFFQSLQPSEIMKLGLILFFAKYFSEKMSYEDLQEWDPGFKTFVAIAGSVVLLIMLQPDLGSALVLAVIGAVMYFVAGANRQHFVTCILAAFLIVPIILGISDHGRQRVLSFLNPQEDCREEASCWQTRQASVAIGSGGFFGRGLAKGVQKQYWLPQAVDDFIFSASSEELGFLRMSGIVFLYAVVVYRGFRIAQYASTPFVALAASGISAWIGAQSFINIMVNIGLFPVTGITLPFFSYGGSSMVMTLVAVGILLNLSQYKTNNVYRIHGGGTGGHVVPNLAILEELTKEYPVAYIGSEKGPEKALIQAENYPFYSIYSGKWRRYMDWRNLRDPFLVFIGIFQSIFLLKKLKAQLLFSKGGFVALPVVIAAWILRIPVWVHESDQSPGLTSRLSMPLAARVWIGEGVPVRRRIAQGSLEQFEQIFKFKKHKKILLFLGGSMGAEELNQWVKKHQEILLQDYQIVHIFGHGKGEAFQNESMLALPYVREGLEHIYASADLVVTRAGATSLAELELCHKRVILWPLGLNQSRGDQLENARFFLKKYSFWEMLEAPEALVSQIHRMMNKELVAPKEKAVSLAKKIAQEIMREQEASLWIPSWFYDKAYTGIGYFTAQMPYRFRHENIPYKIRFLKPKYFQSRRLFEWFSSLQLLWKARKDAIYFLYPQLLCPMWTFLRSKKTKTFLQIHDWIEWERACRSKGLKYLVYRYIAWSYRNIDKVAFVSESVKQEFLESSAPWRKWFSWQESQCLVVPNVLGESWGESLLGGLSSSQKHEKKEKTFVYFAGYDKRKRVPEMIQFFLKMKAAWLKKRPQDELRLHLFGEPHFFSSAYDDPSLFKDPSLFLRGRVSEDLLRSCVEKAFGMLHFSEAEGFNLPLLQSMSLGVPSLVRDLKVHREVAGEGAAFFTKEDEALELILAWQDPAVYETISRKAYEKAQENQERKALKKFLT